MRGQVAEYDEGTQTGVIVNGNGRRFTFTRADWQPERSPKPGQNVIFSPEGTTAQAIGLPDPEPEFHASDRTIGWLWTSLQGRATRTDFWIRYVLLAVPIVIVAGLIDASMGTRRNPGYVVGLIAYIALFWPSLAVGIKRLHDCNLPGYHVVALFALQIGATVLLYILIDARIIRSKVGVYAIQAIPFLYGLWQFIVMGFFRGTDGENDYGPDPHGTTNPQFTLKPPGGG